MAQELVTLQHPDGRRHRTDNASEINMLISTYGYQRVDEANTGQHSPSRSKRSARPTAPPPEQSEPTPVSNTDSPSS